MIEPTVVVQKIVIGACPSRGLGSFLPSHFYCICVRRYGRSKAELSRPSGKYPGVKLLFPSY